MHDRLRRLKPSSHATVRDLAFNLAPLYLLPQRASFKETVLDPSSERIEIPYSLLTRFDRFSEEPSKLESQ